MAYRNSPTLFRFAKRLPGFRNNTYKQRLGKLNLATLELRRLHNDLIMCYKIIFGLVHLRMEDFFQFSPVNTTRGHPYKLFVPQCTLDVRKHFFAVRVVKTWNNLPGNTAFGSLNQFKLQDAPGQTVLGMILVLDLRAGQFTIDGQSKSIQCDVVYGRKFM